MPHTLPPLPYDAAALEPHIDSQTMQIHHGKHHQAYVTNLNAALDKHPELHNKSLDDLLKGINSVPDDIKAAVRNNGGGHWNHSMFWKLMAPNAGGAPKGAVADAINSAFGDFEKFKTAVNQAGTTRFGSGWAWVIDNGGKLEVDQHAEPGQPVDGREEGDPRHRRVGARLLPEIPEPPPRLPRRVVERGQLGRSQSTAEGLTLAFLLILSATAAAQSAEPKVTGTVSNITRVESWSYFEPRLDTLTPGPVGEPDYTFIGDRAELGVLVAGERFDLSGVFNYVRLENLPTNAIGPGGFGSGAFYFAATGVRYSYQLYLSELTVTDEVRRSKPISVYWQNAV